MKTYIGYLIFMCSLLLCSCQQTTSNPRFYDEGVSQELATLRKQEIKELKYKLYFSIPEQKSVPVNGEITIEFNLDAPQEIILDFREKPEKINRYPSMDKLPVMNSITSTSSYLKKT